MFIYLQVPLRGFNFYNTNKHDTRPFKEKAECWVCLIVNWDHFIKALLQVCGCQTRARYSNYNPLIIMKKYDPPSDLKPPDIKGEFTSMSQFAADHFHSRHLVISLKLPVNQQKVQKEAQKRLQHENQLYFAPKLLTESGEKISHYVKHAALTWLRSVN